MGMKENYCMDCKEYKGKTRHCNRCNRIICVSCGHTGYCIDCEAIIDLQRKKSYDTKILISIGLILILSLSLMLFIGGLKVQEKSLSNDKKTVTTDYLTDCNNGLCSIEVDFCSDEKIDKKPKIYLEKTKYLKEYIDVNNLGSVDNECKKEKISIEVPLFSTIKYGVLWDDIDLDPYINATEYISNFTIDSYDNTTLDVGDFWIAGSGNTELSTDTLAYISFDNGTISPNAEDITGNGNDYILFNTPLIVDSVIDEGLRYNAGDNEYLLSNSGFVSTDLNFTVCLWGYTNVSDSTLYAESTASNGNNFIAIRMFDGIYDFLVKDGTDTAIASSTSGLSESTVPMFICVVRDDYNFEFYLNGTLTDNNSYPLVDIPVGVSKSSIGALKRLSLEAYITGEIDEVMKFNRTITRPQTNCGSEPNNELCYLYNEGLPTTSQQYPFQTGGNFESINFTVNESIGNFTPYFNCDGSCNLSISFDGGDTYFYNVTDSEPYLLDNASTMNYILNLSYGNFTYLNITSPIGCIESWTYNITACMDYNQTIWYYDVNSCGTYTDLPGDNGSIISCGTASVQGNLTIPSSLSFTPDKETTAGILTWFLFFALLVGVIIWYETSRIGALLFVVLIYGLFLSLITAFQISTIISSLLFMATIIYFISGLSRM